MPGATKLAIGGASFLCNLLVLAGAVVLVGALAAPAVFIAVFLLGFSVGCLLGSAFKASMPWAVGVGAFAATLLMYLPVVFATYGFALLGLPLLVLYAACVAAGAHLVRRGSATKPHSS
jgi:hypothetical protein